MLHTLQFDVTFPSTGRRLAQDLKFEGGFTAITGANESGKSFIFEMIRFCLFGTAALRGASDDYKTLKASAEFTIKGERYGVIRSMKTATLKRGEEVVASGVTAVNMKVVETLGFGLAVFDMACSINQGEVERLGTLTAGQRKQLVDQVLGIDALEVVSKWAMDEARVLDKEAEAIRRGLHAPVPPVVPENYVPSEQTDLVQLQRDAAELASLNGFLSVEREAPVMPTCKVDLPAENLVVFAEKRKTLRETVARLEAQVAALPTSAPAVPEDIEAQWEAFDAYANAQRWLQANPKPQYRSDQIDVFRDDWKALDNIMQRKALTARIEQLMAKGSKPCPHCHEDIPLEQETIEGLQSAHDALVVPNDGYVPPTPPLSMQQIATEALRIQSFDADTHAALSAIEPVAEPSVPRHLIATYRAQAEQVVERAEIVDQLSIAKPQLAAMPDYEQMLVERTAYEAALPVYRETKAAYEAWCVERAQKKARAAALEGAQERLAEGQATRAAAQVYEAALASFQETWDRYTKQTAEADELEAKADEHRKVRELMNVLRSLIKQHLMPSLNRVASHLLSQMTGGQRNVVAVDEDFNVVIDGQDLDTLSGSGKACANLALRIALGQVLTNRVFSVLMADEIDAAMDDFRAEQTSNVLCMLANSISQVLQVSHKSIESVNQIDLGGPVVRSQLGEAA